MDIARTVRQFAAFAVLGAVVWFGGALLVPPRWSVTRSRAIAAPTDRIQPYIADLAKWPTWNVFEREESAMEALVDVPGMNPGAHRSWTKSVFGPGEQTLVEAGWETGAVSELHFDGRPLVRSTFTYETESGGVVRVVWTLSGETHGNTTARWKSLLAGSALGPRMQAALRELQTAVMTRR